jgi:tetratricopeptide (TPR) repeat protein/CHAT domain-containing protein
MPQELNLEFISNTQFTIHFGERHSDALNFESPINDEDKKDIQWYLEKYATLYMADVDDERAAKIVANLPQWGQSLFNAVFKERAAYRLYEDFLEAKGHLLTISAKHPAILSLPWELLYDPESTFLSDHDPTISIRHRLGSADKALKPFEVKSKARLLVLFVISRPSDVSLIDHRADAKAVLAAIDEETSGRFDLEFLRPATLENLTKRLERRAKYRNFLPVDVIHFDGHGVFAAETSGYESKTMAETKKASGGMGYLLFENTEGEKKLVDATTLGNMLNQKKVALIILSACQSAAMEGDEPMGSVAARLTHAGIPAVLAMTHSVLVATTQQLFATFYESLAYGAGIGQALDDARRHLYSHPERGERQRGQDRITLKLYDWFLPALYQGNEDTPLINNNIFPKKPLPINGKHNLHQYQQEFRKTAFVGRTRELWQIERTFVIQDTRRLTISGFGGQGKTTLAIEAGEWLHRTGLFQFVCFVDYASFQGVDAVGLAISTLATVFDKNLVDVEAVNVALLNRATLLILDNLEAITKIPPNPPLPKGGNLDLDLSKGGNLDLDFSKGGESAESMSVPHFSKGGLGGISPLKELLDVAQKWSEIGKCRILLTTRSPDFHHAGYPTEGSLIHQLLALRGLAENDALAYFQRLLKLPPAPQVDLPKREAVLALFRQVSNHPLSIGLIARQLKVRRVAELGMRLEKLLEEMPDNPLLASLNLSLDRLDEEARGWLPKLGVFQGGAMLTNLFFEITGFTKEQWKKLYPALETTGLIQMEYLAGGKLNYYLKFHPTLAPALWTRLTTEEQAQLQASHRQRYYELSGYLYDEDRKNPYEIRAIVQRELPNLLFAVHGALDAEETYSVEFVRNVNEFLDFFGLNRDSKALSQRIEHLDDFLAHNNKGEQLFSAGQYQAAAQVFSEILTGLGDEPSFNHSLTLLRLGRCFKKQGQAAQAAECYCQGLAVAEQLEPSEDVKRKMGVLQTDLADALRDMGEYDDARKAYEKSLAIDKELGDARGKAVSEGQLGTLAMRQENLQEAAQHHTEALAIFHSLNEPEMEAVAHHQLGMVYQKAEQWDAAEQAYRESARIEESQGNLAGAAQTWNNLAIVTKGAGKPEEAEAWYRKAIEGKKATVDIASLSSILNNLANLLQTHYPNRLPEARQLMEDALAIDKTLDPAAAEIWKTYLILAEIAEKQNDTAKASEYRRQSREAYQGFQGVRYQLQKYEKLIAGVVAAVGDAKVRQELESGLETFGETWKNLVAAIQRILDGERDEKVLCEPLDYRDGAIINAILRGIAGQ